MRRTIDHAIASCKFEAWTAATEKANRLIGSAYLGGAREGQADTEMNVTGWSVHGIR